MFGDYNEEHFTTPLVWHNVVHSTYWMLNLTNIYVGNKSINYCQEHKCGIVIDSGTSMITAPSLAMSQMDGMITFSSSHHLFY